MEEVQVLDYGETDDSSRVRLLDVENVVSQYIDAQENTGMIVMNLRLR